MLVCKVGLAKKRSIKNDKLCAVTDKNASTIRKIQQQYRYMGCMDHKNRNTRTGKWCHIKPPAHLPGLYVTVKALSVLVVNG